MSAETRMFDVYWQECLYPGSASVMQRDFAKTKVKKTWQGRVDTSERSISHCKSLIYNAHTCLHKHTAGNCVLKVIDKSQIDRMRLLLLMITQCIKALRHQGMLQTGLEN